MLSGLLAAQYLIKIELAANAHLPQKTAVSTAGLVAAHAISGEH